MKEYNIKYHTKQNSNNNHDFEKIVDMIKVEPNLLHPSADSLKSSYENEEAIVMYDGENLVGFVRLSPLLDRKIKNYLELSEDFPDISEIGSAVIINKPEYRRKGLYAPLRNSLLESVNEKISHNNLLILGTTKIIAVYKVLSESQNLGIDFYPSVHTEFPMIAPFTCVCNPDFGCGFHISNECPQRVTSQQLIDLEDISIKSGGKIPCIMYVSSKNLAESINTNLQVHFGNNMQSAQKNLIASLKDNTYYD